MALNVHRQLVCQCGVVLLDLGSTGVEVLSMTKARKREQHQQSSLIEDETGVSSNFLTDASVCRKQRHFHERPAFCNSRWI